ncbi:MAG: GAF domain-containing protein [Nitrospirae bacterium]|nr:GAF domain-containing protein [Nitrospirota bacterium]
MPGKTNHRNPEEELKRLNEAPETRVGERTRSLLRISEELKAQIAERKAAEASLVRLNRLYSLRNRLNKAIARMSDVTQLYEEVCRITVESDFFRMAWIGIADPETHKVNPVAKWGDTGGYLDNLTIVAADVPEGRGPTARSIYELKSVVCADIEAEPMRLPWRDKALAHGFRSSAAFPIRAGSVVIGALSVYAGTPQFFSDKELYLLQSLAEDISYATDAIENEKKRLEAERELSDSREELRRLSNHLLNAREEERTRVGRNIHDELGQILTAATIELGRAERQCKDNGLKKKIGEISELIDIAVDDVHRICSDLRPRVLDHLGLVPALKWQAGEFSKMSEIRCILDLPGNEVQLPAEISTALFRICQEALTNVVRHSGADEVAICLNVAEDIRLEIKDNGKRVSPDKFTNSNSYGMMGIRERARMLGGAVIIESGEDGGMTIAVEVPLRS